MNTLENSCFRYDGSDDSKNIIRIMNKNHRSNFKGNDKYFYWIANNIAYTFYKMDKDLTEIPPYDYLALLTGKQLTEGERKDELEKLLVVGAKIKVGKKYAEENSCVEGEIFELVEGHFEYDNGLYTEDQTAPSIWEEISKEFNSIYHLFGNNLENFMDCEVLHSSHSETVPVQEEVKGKESDIVKKILNDINGILYDLIARFPMKEREQYDYKFKEFNVLSSDLLREVKYENRKQTAHLQQQLKEAKELLKESFSVIQAVSTLLRVAPNNNTLPEPPHDVIKLVKSIDQFLTRNK